MEPLRDDEPLDEVHIEISKDSMCVRQAVDFDTPEGAEMLRKMLSPWGVQYHLHAGIGNCWLALPDYSRNLAALRREMKQLMELTMENLHVHPQAFGFDGEPIDPQAAEFRTARLQGDPALLMLHVALETCRQMLPADRRNVSTVESESRLLFDEALAEVRIGSTGFVEWP